MVVYHKISFSNLSGPSHLSFFREAREGTIATHYTSSSVTEISQFELVF